VFTSVYYCVYYIYIYQVEEGQGSTTLMSANRPSRPATLHLTEFPPHRFLIWYHHLVIL
jgi:hypothetical protein